MTERYECGICDFVETAEHCPAHFWECYNCGISGYADEWPLCDSCEEPLCQNCFANSELCEDCVADYLGRGC